MQIPDLNYHFSKHETHNDNQDFFTVEDQEENDSEDDIGTKCYQEDFKVLLEDQLNKKTMNISWKARYFCLTSSRLIYYADSTKEELKGCFNFASLCRHLLFLEVREEEKILRYNFCYERLSIFLTNENLSQQQTLHELLTLSFKEVPHRLGLWKNSLNLVIEKASRGIVKNAPPIPAELIKNPSQKINHYNFWNRVVISEEEFKSYGNHLDIVFLRSNKSLSSFQRLLMRSHFDHVGLLLKDVNNNLLFLEAIESRGVWMNDWDKMIPIMKEHYEEIAYRKLLIPSGFVFDYEKLEAFLEEVIDSKYELSFSKLFVREETEIVFDGITDEPQKTKAKKLSKKEKTYFCSELIAHIYLKLGFLKGRKRNEFWPKDFEQELALEKGLKLGPLMHIYH